MVLSLKTLLCIGCGCFAGGVLRYLTSYYICTRWQISATDMPWHTLFINFGGCLFMGLFCGLATAGFIESPNLRLALTAGSAAAIPPWQPSHLKTPCSSAPATFSPPVPT